MSTKKIFWINLVLSLIIFVASFIAIVKSYDVLTSILFLFSVYNIYRLLPKKLGS